LVFNSGNVACRRNAFWWKILSPVRFPGAVPALEVLEKVIRKHHFFRQGGFRGKIEIYLQLKIGWDFQGKK